MPTVNTATGPVDTTTLGFTLVHEHVARETAVRATSLLRPRWIERGRPCVVTRIDRGYNAEQFDSPPGT